MRTGPSLPQDWSELLADVFGSPEYARLRSFLKERYASEALVSPGKCEIFKPLKTLPVDDVRIVIVGGVPYRSGIATGLAFGAPSGVPTPRSLLNVFRELKSDLNLEIPRGQNTLEGWAKQGILLINAQLTGEPGSPHADWEFFTSNFLKALANRAESQGKVLHFLFWGDVAKKHQYATGYSHYRYLAGGPEPSTVADFFGCRHFSQVNANLMSRGESVIDWSDIDGHKKKHFDEFDLNVFFGV